MKCVLSLKILFLSAETCEDDMMNQDETGVDCGGSNCPVCGKYLYYRGNDYKKIDINIADKCLFCSSF